MHTATSKQHKDPHKDLRPSTQSRDNRVHVIFVQWLKVRLQFVGYEANRLLSLSIGFVSDASVNCNNALEISRAAA